jgi:calcineurin-like phosphoesterase family protein
LDALNCKNIILIRGNHDKWQAIPKDKVLSVLNSCVLTIYGQILLLSHYPYRITVWRAIKAFRRIKSQRHFEELFSKVRPKDTGLWLLHGHTHASTILADYHPRMIHVGVDANKFCPISGEDVIAIIQQHEARAVRKKSFFKKIVDWVKSKLYTSKANKPRTKETPND